MGGEPVVSVIIPVRDDPRLARCLTALRDQTFPAALTEVVVADNGSAVPPDVSAYPGAVVVSQPGGGSYAARNRAVEHARGRILAFTDSDCLPEPSWLSEAVAAIDAGASVVAGRVSVYARDDARPHPVEAYELVHAFPQEVYVSRDGACVTANLVTTRAAFEQTGPFRSELYSGADIEWSQRANGRGLTAVYCAGSVVRHPARSSYAAMWTKLRRVVAGRHERDVLDGLLRPAPWPTVRALVPPVGAFRRARRADALVTWHARLAFLVGEWFHRYAAAAAVLELAVTDRRRRVRRTG